MSDFMGAAQPQNVVAFRFYERHGMKIEGTGGMGWRINPRVYRLEPSSFCSSQGISRS